MLETTMFTSFSMTSDFFAELCNSFRSRETIPPIYNNFKLLQFVANYTYRPPHTHTQKPYH